jgi:mono/diheme cytochrome c family protein
MRRLVRIVVRIAAALVVFAVLAIAVVYLLTERRMARTYRVSVPAFTVPADAVAVKRGERLARVVLPCFDCHAQDYGGKVLVDDVMMGRLGAANLTRGRGGIAATYTDEDWARALLHGVRKDGHSVIFMPSHEFKISAPDLADMVAYFRSLPPVDRRPPPVRIGPMPRLLSYIGFPLLPAELIDHATVAFKPPLEDATPLAQGEHLAVMSCTGCHKEDFTGGGGPPPGASNITPVGIGTWTDADFMRALREHVRPNGTKLDEAMPRAFGQMTDDELKAIFIYLKTLPAKGERRKNQQKSS